MLLEALKVFLRVSRLVDKRSYKPPVTDDRKIYSNLQVYFIVVFVKSFHRYSGHEKPTGNLTVKIASVTRKIN